MVTVAPSECDAAVVLSAPLVNPDKISVPESFPVYEICSLPTKTPPVAGKDPYSAKVKLVAEASIAPSRVEVKTYPAVPPQDPKPHPAVDSSTAGPIE